MTWLWPWPSSPSLLYRHHSPNSAGCNNPQMQNQEARQTPRRHQQRHPEGPHCPQLNKKRHRTCRIETRLKTQQSWSESPWWAYMSSETGIVHPQLQRPHIQQPHYIEEQFGYFEELRIGWGWTGKCSAGLCEEFEQEYRPEWVGESLWFGEGHLGRADAFGFVIRG